VSAPLWLAALSWSRRPRGAPRFPALTEDGKEAAVGSSPTEGFKILQIGGFVLPS